MMMELHDLPDDLATCQQMLRELLAAHERLQQVYEELLATCTSMQDERAKFEQEKEELEATIKELINRLHGRSSERQKYSPDQLSLDFGEGDVIEVVPDVTEDEEFVAEQDNKKKRRRRRRKGSKGFPAHLERRSQRIEPELPEGIRLEDCEEIGGCGGDSRV
jgi:chromosome segregation ATPase